MDLLVLPGGLPGPRFFSVGWSAGLGLEAAAAAAAACCNAAAGSSPNLMLAEGTVPGRTAVVLVVACPGLAAPPAAGSWA